MPYTQVTPKEKKKSHGFLKFLFILLLVICAAGGYFLYSLDLYVYSTTSFNYSNVSASDRMEIESIFIGNYLIKEDDGCYVFDPESGLGFHENALKDSDEIIVSFTCHTNYAFIEMTSPNTDEKITISFYRANLLERVKFASRYYF